MATRHKKTRKLRGSRTHGWGRSGQHRNSGMLGGHGNAGLTRGKKSSVIRYGLQLREKGFKPANPMDDRYINIGQVNLQLDRLTAQGHARQDNNKTEINLTQAGYQKLLGEGRVDKPLRIIVPKASEKAAQKISQAGGEIVLPQQQKED